MSESSAQDRHGPIVVGVGAGVGVAGSADRSALEWAADEAASRGVDLELRRAFVFADRFAPHEVMYDAALRAELRADAEQLLTAAAAAVAERHPHLEVTRRLVDGDEVGVLAGRAADAAVTVVGSRRHTAIAELGLGSTAHAVAAAAHGPVVVVKGPGGLAGEPHHVVVGVDGSPASERAVQWAFAYADRHGLDVRAVLVHGHAPSGGIAWRPERDRTEDERRLADAIAPARRAHPGVRVHPAVREGHPAAVLVDESSGEDLVVIGCRGRHARTATLLGSVAQAVLRHATCPVVVLHAQATDEAPVPVATAAVATETP
ncbi:universal stress protein [Jatrophihabitans fulvus]